MDGGAQEDLQKKISGLKEKDREGEKERGDAAPLIYNPCSILFMECVRLCLCVCICDCVCVCVFMFVCNFDCVTSFL